MLRFSFYLIETLLITGKYFSKCGPVKKGYRLPLEDVYGYFNNFCRILRPQVSAKDRDVMWVAVNPFVIRS